MIETSIEVKHATEQPNDFITFNDLKIGAAFRITGFSPDEVFIKAQRFRQEDSPTTFNTIRFSGRKGVRAQRVLNNPVVEPVNIVVTWEYLTAH